MRRAIQRLVQDPLALKVISGDFQEGDTILVDAAPDGAELTFAKLVPVLEPAGCAISRLHLTGSIYELRTLSRLLHFSAS